MTDDRPTTDRAETALFELLADHPFAEIRLAAIAERAGVPLADLRAAYDGPLDILSGFARRIDVAVLAGDDPSMAGESRRERLLDALMRRFDLLAPHRAGLAGLRRSARRDWPASPSPAKPSKRSVSSRRCATSSNRMTG